ncbi:unnamed protein product [Albugo candida]|uniref:Uncharacterized protein n=1 Tax=Albugo candida TaxID=65357 RepID=A0A024G5X8_9STRA|nr:unnamed protein product [Albugo candida]|eukprot:CCI41725.1 unnamed protein product [Albugo candida]
MTLPIQNQNVVRTDVPLGLFASPSISRIVMSSDAIVRKASSTFCAFLALVSRNGMDRLSANAFAVSYDTARFSAISLLFPTNSLHVPSLAYRFTSFSQSFT